MMRRAPGANANHSALEMYHRHAVSFEAVEDVEVEPLSETEKPRV